MHIHIHPRYSSSREFKNYTFNDEGWGRKVKSLSEEKLASKELVFKITNKLRDNLKEMNISDLDIKVMNNH